MRDEILGQAREAMPLDGVLLGLHGAMVADGYDDTEGDLIERMRAIVGPKCVIGVELDLHCHLTVKRVRLSDLIILYKEFPHVDVAERAEELLDLVLKTIRGQVKPVMSLYDCRQIGSYPTTLPLMRRFVDKVKAMEGQGDVLSISINHCFPYADVPELGGRILVVTDRDKARGDELAAEIGQEFVSLRGRTAPRLRRCRRRHRGGPGLRGNAGGHGRPGGQRRRRRAVGQHHDPAPVDRAEGAERGLAPIWDPVAVRLCFDAGLDGELALRLGGKIAPASGQPVDARVKVIGLERDAWQSFGPTRVPLGDCAAVGIGGVEVVLISNRTQALGLELFRNVGIEPTRKKLLVVKSTNHFMGNFGPIAKKVIYVDSDGPLSRDYRRIPYTRVQRPIWPLDEDAPPRLLLTGDPA